VSKDKAINELLVLCAENNVSVPNSLKSALQEEEEGGSIGQEQPAFDDASRAKSSPSDVSILSSLAASHQEDVLRFSEQPIAKEVRNVRGSLKSARKKYEVRIVDGSYTVTNPLPDDYDAVILRRKGHGGDEEDHAAGEEKPHIPTVASSGGGISFVRKLGHFFRTGRFQFSQRTETKVIMDRVNLRLESGKMYLVLGQPGCGKSTLLKIIANNLTQDKGHVVGGTVEINGIERNHKPLYWTNLVSYIDQIDRLHSLLTVKETCDFAFQCRVRTHMTPNMPVDDPEVQERAQKLDAEDWMVTTVLKAMGLLRVKDTFVGDDSKVRGVSGGERKRVTVSEMTCVGAPVQCLDEMSTGLDAATTFDIVRLLGETSRITNTVKIVSLLQPPPETVALFDELILLDKGRIIYSGPVVEVVDHFEDMGYKLPDRMDPADWLQDLPTKDGADFLVNKNQKHLSNEEFVESFVSSVKGQAALEQLKAPWPENDLEPIEGKAYTQRYTNSWFESMNLAFRRELLLWWRDKYQLKARIMQDFLMGIIVGTVFWQQHANPGTVLGVLFQSLFFISLGAMLKVAPQIDVRGIFYKQQDANFYPTGAYVMGRSLAALPTSIIDAVVYGTIIYWFVGLAYNDGATVGNYFMFLLLVLVTAYCAGLTFSIFSAISKDRSTAQAYLSIAVVVMVLFSGFTVQPDIIPNYWIWVYWINMFAWMLRALVVNEYQSGKYSDPVSTDPYAEYGESVLERFGFTLNGEPFSFIWTWYGILFSVGTCLACVLCSVYFLIKIRHETGASLAAHMQDEGDEGFDNEEDTVQLEFPRVNLTFKDIHYTVTASTSDEKLELLKGIDGYIEGGKMTALMGSSGAGKTTLMDVLALRKSSGEIEGEVCLNGHPQESNSFRRCAGYVEQFDTQTPELTIRETVMFSAKMRLDENDTAVNKESLNKWVTQTLKMLELKSIQHFCVGSDLTGGLSFEQRKRLSIAVELASNPSIVFLDEPTSGLDARAASIVMRGLKRISESGRAVCATIHQPSIAIFSSFDSLLLLKRGGETVFFGELGEDSCNLIDYLERYPSTPPIHLGENPATWMLTTIGAGSSPSGDSRPFDYSASYSQSKLRDECIDNINEFNAQATEENKVSFPSKYATCRKTQTRSVLRRMLKVYWRSPTYNRTRTLVAAIIALLFGSVFAAQRVPETESDMNSRVTSIYITCLFLGVNSFNTVLPVYETERNMYYRHKAALMYDHNAINLAFTVSEIPFICFSSMIFCICFYFLLGFSTLAYKFFLYYLFLTLNMAFWTFLGQGFMALFKDSVTAQGFGAVINGLSSIFTGVLIRPQYIAGFWTWAYWVMPGHYVLEGLLVSQFHEDNTPIIPYVGSPFYDYVRKTYCPGAEYGEPLPSGCTGTAEEWIYVSFGGKFVWGHLGANIIYLVLVLLLSKLVAFVALKRLNYLAK